jgi:hypothetical protein
MRRCDYCGGKLGLIIHLIRDPLEACFAPAAGFGRSSIPCATNGYLPPAGLKLESLSYLPSSQSLSGSSIMSGMRSLFLPLAGACASILPKSSARIGEYFCQLLAPIVEISLLGDVTAVQGIGARLARDGHAMPANADEPARRQRLDRLHGVPGCCPAVSALAPGWL